MNVLKQDQIAQFSGFYPNPGSYDELIIGQPNSIKITEKFLQFEHTDGLNYVNTELDMTISPQYLILPILIKFK
jgi:hypothetical protein